jgi:sugar phosphate isomerase/epimerase
MTTYRWSFERDVEQYRRLGLAGIGVWRQKLSDYGEERGIELIHDTGLKVSNLLWAGGFTGSDGRSFRESVEDALEACQLAAAMNADCLLVYTGPRAGHTANHARRLVKDALKELLPAAAELGVPLALEPVPTRFAANWTFLTDLEQAASFLSAYGSPWLKLALDTYYFGRDPMLLERIGELAPLIAVVHLGDGREATGPEQDRTCLGCGNVPLLDIVAALESANYQGLYDLELVGQEIERRDYVDLLEHSKQAFEQLYHAVRVG